MVASNLNGLPLQKCILELYYCFFLIFLVAFALLEKYFDAGQSVGSGHRISRHEEEAHYNISEVEGLRFEVLYTALYFRQQISI